MARRFGVTVDCRDPAALAAFWCRILGYVEDLPPDGYPDWATYDVAHGISAEQAAAGMTILDPAGTGPRPYFQRVPEPKITKNRWHLDVQVAIQQQWSEVEEAARAAESAGAVVLRRSADPDDPFIVLTDPEGNEFCLVS